MSSEKTQLQQRLMNTKEVAHMLSISPFQLYRMRANGEGPPAIKIGRLYKYRPEAVQRWLETQEGIMHRAEESSA